MSYKFSSGCVTSVTELCQAFLIHIFLTDFTSVLEALDQDLKDASFLAIDAEFTGLKENSTKFSPLDTPPDRFDKIIKSSIRFLVIQFGPGIFQYDRTKLNLTQTRPTTFMYFLIHHHMGETTISLYLKLHAFILASSGFLASKGLTSTG